MLILNRHTGTSFQITGELSWLDEDYVVGATWTSLELPWLDNERNLSCIPNGYYCVTRRWSPKFNHHLHIIGVKDRSKILIHVGNYRRDTEGCILIGRSFIDIDGDGHLDVTNSRLSMVDLLTVVDSDTEILITSNFRLDEPR